MKTSVGITLAAVAFATLAGCATTGAGNQPASQWEATGAQGAIVKTASANQPIVKADTKENFDAVESAIKQQMRQGGRWQYTSASDRATIDASFANMQSLFDRYGSVDKMDAAAKTQLASDQSTVNALLTKTDGNRIICKMAPPMGSHIPMKVCQTYAEIEAQQRGAQRFLEDRNAAGNVTTQSDHLPIGGGPGTH